eukprot:gnl/Trimastix_PCT/3255.p1 GENE.gnl/Trimastix_PCT/3255~~gnl/Trimastix_PCT/3255.p1  ORF type:complete len:310 (+),score=14.75 gnl/Trimastix_PCT/3255:60-989(+)
MEPKATHLIFLVHGIAGHASDLFFVKNSLLEEASKTAQHVSVCVPICNEGKTFQGIEICGQRIADEILMMERDSSKLEANFSFSIVGHSLGGLFVRYALGVLHRQGFFERHPARTFLTFATPHIGVHSSGALVAWGARVFARRSGCQLALRDTDQDEPLLLSLCKGEFIAALSRFERRVVYANTSGEFSVVYPSAAICNTHPYRGAKNLRPISAEYPHIVHVAPIPRPAPEKMMDVSAYDTRVTRPDELAVVRSMLRALWVLSWERVDCALPSTLRPFGNAHVHMVVKKPGMMGGDVVQHACCYLVHHV